MSMRHYLTNIKLLESTAIYEQNFKYERSLTLDKWAKKDPMEKEIHQKNGNSFSLQPQNPKTP